MNNRRLAHTSFQVLAPLLLALAVALGAGAAPAARGAQAAAPSLRVDAPRQVGVGQAIEGTLTVSGAAAIAGYETALLYDTSAAEFAGLRQRENDLKRLGRDVGPLAVEQMPNGSAIGLYSCATAD